MYDVLVSLEESGLGLWVRESPSMFAYTGLITLHAIGLAFAVGVSWTCALRVLGVARSVPLDAMTGLFPIAWIGFWLCALSGVALAIGHATTDLTSPIFFAKLTLIGLSVVLTRKLRRDMPQPSRLLAGAVLLGWAAAIIAGRLNEYPVLLGFPG